LVLELFRYCYPVSFSSSTTFKTVAMIYGTMYIILKFIDFVIITIPNLEIAVEHEKKGKRN
jgi:hypothetical protein